MEKVLRVASESEMIHLGEKLGKKLKSGYFVCLYGDLGAGKSVLARGIGLALGISSLPSPTFTIVQEYPSDPPLFHFDAYRIMSEEELLGIGYEDYLSRGGIIVMEWADLVPGCLPVDRIEIHITRDVSESRCVSVSSPSSEYDWIIEQL